MLTWNTLDKDETAKVIKAVKDSGEPSLFSPGTSEGRCTKLPFYRNYLLYRITNYASLPAFSFDYLGFGKRFFYLDGTFEPLFGLNKSDNFVLNKETLTDYVEFYFHHVRNDDGEIRILRSLHDHAGLDSLPPAEFYDLEGHNWTPVATQDNDSGLFHLSAVLDNSGTLVKADIEIDDAGRITIKDQKLLSSLSSDQATGTNA